MVRSVKAISWVTIIWLAATLAVAGCKSRERREKKPDETPVTVTKRSTSLGLRSFEPERKVTQFQKPPELPQIEPISLVEPGVGQRRALRYAVAAGQRQFTARGQFTVREYGDGTWRDPMTLPAIELGLEIIRIDGRDDLQVRGLAPVIAQPAPDQDAKRVNDAAAQFLGRYRAYVERRRATITLNERGVLGEMRLSPDAKSSADASLIQAELTELILERAVPLPEEPVAKGARWRQVALLWRGQAVVKQTDEYELLAVDKDRVRLALTSTQVGEHQAVTGPDLPPGYRAELVALLRKTHGELELDLGAPLPVAGKLDIELRVHGRLFEMQTGKEHEYFLENNGAFELQATPLGKAAPDAGPDAAPDVVAPDVAAPDAKGPVPATPG